ncbi:Stromal cell-derived factor 2-like protein 1 [Entophlyctis luteolus]|nr:Stromal cell-derived factor 2-like protein 1 [Entophlyctis luteolus]KAJ3390057.1 Stromal cell-derived factor 2-like protein 1 [Entophlyctis sp. JEL0112]
MRLLPAILGCAVASTVAAAEDFVIEKEFETVTCGSSIKLAHSASGFRLHSHQITYGTGSGQQSVTGMDSADDSKFVSPLAFGY